MTLGVILRAKPKDLTRVDKILRLPAARKQRGSLRMTIPMSVWNFILLSPIDEIKNKLDLVEVISGYIKLQKAGRNLRANCPFHHEKTPSFMVSPERQIWHCFGCGKGGDIFGFVKEIEGIEFIDALRLLAQRAGVALKKQDPKLRSERQRLYEINELAAKFFLKQKEATIAGKKIVKYLSDRGLSRESINEWRIGYAPDDWHSLSNFLKKRGYTDKEIIRSGVVVEKDLERGQTEAIANYYDRFRDRIIFPIVDSNGQVVGFGARVAPWGKKESAKYINTSQTPIYDKSRILYGLDKAKLEIRQADNCIMVEGYTDVIMSYQAGVKNVIASSGTALTEDQLRIIRRYTENLTLGFDMDIAGDTATKRAIDLALTQGFDVKILPLIDKGEAKDPADIIRENPKKWQQIIGQAQGVIKFYFANSFKNHNSKEAKGKKQIAKILLPLIKKIPDKIEQAHWIQELAGRLQIQEKILIEAMKGVNIKSTENARIIKEEKSAKGQQAKPRQTAMEEELISIIYGLAEDESNSKELKEILADAEVEKFFLDPNFSQIFRSFKEYSKKHSAIEAKKWKASVDPEQALLLDQIILQLEIKQIEKEKLKDYFSCCFEELRKEAIRRQLTQLQYDIKNLESQKDKKKLEALLGEFKKAASKLNETNFYGKNKKTNKEEVQEERGGKKEQGKENKKG